MGKSVKGKELFTGLGESSLDHRRREEFPVFFCSGERKNHCISVGNAVYYI